VKLTALAPKKIPNRPSKLPLILAVRLEDGRQRHPNDTVPELAAAG